MEADVRATTNGNGAGQPLRKQKGSTREGGKPVTVYGTGGCHKLLPHHGRPPAGQAHIGFIVDDIQAVYESLKAQDVMFSLSPQKQVSGVTLAVLHDPDGLGITLQQR